MLTNEKKDEIQKLALEAIGDKKKAGIVASMGVGKTLIGLKHMTGLYHKDARFLVVVPKNSIIDSWKKDAIEFDLDYLLNHIEFVNYRSLAKVSHFDFDVVYLDECHSLKFSHGDWLSIYEIRFQGTIIGLTGTYPRFRNGEKGKMCGRFCPKVYEYSTDEAISDMILNDYRIIVHQLPLSVEKDIVKKRKDGKTWKTSERDDYDYWTRQLSASMNPGSTQQLNIMRMKALQSFSTKEKYTARLLTEITDKVIVFANTQAQADRLCEHSFHSKNARSDKNLDLFKRGEIHKLSAVEQLSEGISVPQLKVAVIMHSFGNNRRAPQKLGRVLRLNPDDMATVHILCYVATVDKTWVENALKAFDKSKITWTTPRKYFEQAV